MCLDIVFVLLLLLKWFNSKFNFLFSRIKKSNFYSIFQQRFKERLGSQWAHITSQPEVEEAIKRVQDMYDYFESLEKIIRKQKLALEKMNDIELELSLWYRKEGYVCSGLVIDW